MEEAAHKACWQFPHGHGRGQLHFSVFSMTRIQTCAVPTITARRHAQQPDLLAWVDPELYLQYLLRTNCGKSAGTDGEKILKIGELNHKLDELVAASGNAKATTLAWLIRNTSPRLMKWIICIILKDLKVWQSFLEPLFCNAQSNYLASYYTLCEGV